MTSCRQSCSEPVTGKPVDPEQGRGGLWYLTDPNERGVFIAAPTEDGARTLAVRARQALQSGRDTVPMHDLHVRTPGGGLITVPKPGWMTPKQRSETIARLNAHLAARFVS